MAEKYDASKLALLIIRIKESAEDMLTFADELGNMMGINLPSDVYIPKTKNMLDIEQFFKEMEIRKKQFIALKKKEEKQLEREIKAFADGEKKKSKVTWEEEEEEQGVPKWIWKTDMQRYERAKEFNRAR